VIVLSVQIDTARTTNGKQINYLRTARQVWSNLHGSACRARSFSAKRTNLHAKHDDPETRHLTSE